jgi:hypothetical protein
MEPRPQYEEIANDGTGDIDEEHTFDNSYCDECNSIIGAYLEEDPYTGFEKPRWNVAYLRLGNEGGKIICEDCLPFEAVVKWLK